MLTKKISQPKPHKLDCLAKTFMERMEAIGYHVAAGHIDRDLLTEVMRSIVDDEDYSESTKLDLIAAMSQEVGFSEE